MAKDSKKEDLGLKMGSKDMAHWQSIVDALESTQRNLHTERLFNDANLRVAKYQLECATTNWNKVK